MERKESADEEYRVEFAKASSPVAQKLGPILKKVEKALSDDDAGGQLTVDVYQNPSEIVIESAIAGVKPEDLDISVNKDSISIKGERHREKEVKGDDYLYQECYWGKFSRAIILPQEIDPDKATVSFKNGILSVRLPKREEQKSKKLKIKLE